MTRLTGIFLAAITATLFATGAWAQSSVGIGAFFGEWSGSAISESNISVNFQLTARDMDV